MSFSKLPSVLSRLPRFTSPVSFSGLRVYRQYWTQLLCVFTFAVLCQSAFLEVEAAGNLQGCLTGTYDPNTDYFPDKSIVTIAEDYTISYHKNYKIVSDIDPSSPETYVLFQCGTPVPVKSNFPNGTKFFSIPPKTVSTQDTTTNAFLNALGPDVLATIKAISAGGATSVPCIQKRLDNGTMAILGDENAPITEIYFGASPYAEQTTELEVEDSSFNEDTVLKRAEWLKYYGAFYNKETTANEIFERMTNNYAVNKSLVTPSTDKLVMAIVYTFGGKWYKSQSGYKIPLVADAGAVLANLSDMYNTTADLIADFQRLNVSILIDENYYPTLPSLDRVLATYGLNQTTAQNYTWAKNIYREDKLISNAYGYNWFDDGQIYAGAVLADFMNVINPIVPPGWQRVWLRNVYTQSPTVITGADCIESFGTTQGGHAKKITVSILVLIAALLL